MCVGDGKVFADDYNELVCLSNVMNKLYSRKIE